MKFNLKLKPTANKEQRLAFADEIRAVPGVVSLEQTFPDEDDADLSGLFILELEDDVKKVNWFPFVEYIEPVAARTIKEDDNPQSRLESVLPHIWIAINAAKIEEPEGTPKLAVVAVKDDGSGFLSAQFDIEFIHDVVKMLGFETMEDLILERRKARTEKISKISAKIQKVKENIEGRRDRFRMYASTQEAFIVDLVAELRTLGIDARKLYWNFLATRPGGPELDVQACRELLQEPFAKETANAALKILDEWQKTLDSASVQDP